MGTAGTMNGAPQRPPQDVAAAGRSGWAEG